MRMLLSTYGSVGSRGDIAPVVGLVVWSRALQACGAEMGRSLVAGAKMLTGGWL